jgi:hypothetical protein
MGWEREKNRPLKKERPVVVGEIIFRARASLGRGDDRWEFVAAVPTAEVDWKGEKWPPENN